MQVKQEILSSYYLISVEQFALIVVSVGHICIYIFTNPLVFETLIQLKSNVCIDTNILFD